MPAVVIGERDVWTVVNQAYDSVVCHATVTPPESEFDILPRTQRPKTVMIGGGCTIMAGVRIGRQSFIAGGALVNKDVPPHSLVMGVPGRMPCVMDEQTNSQE